MLVDDDELAARRRELEADGRLSRIPAHQTPWQEIQRGLVGELETGAVLEPAVKYQRIAQTQGHPARQPLRRRSGRMAKVYGVLFDVQLMHNTCTMHAPVDPRRPIVNGAAVVSRRWSG